MLNFALIGCGTSGRLHAAQMAREHKLVAVCDVDGERAEAVAAEYEARVWASVDELLAGEPSVEVVVVSTPNGLHAEHCIKALQAGRHVLCDGPLCLTPAAAWQMIETEKYCGRRLVVAHAADGNELIKDLAEKLAANSGEQLFSFELDMYATMPGIDSWRHTSFPGGGALYSFFGAEMDLLSYLFGPIASAEGNVEYEGELDVRGDVRLVMENGVTGRLRWTLGDNDAEESSRLSIRAFENEIWSGETDQFHADNDGYYSLYRRLEATAGGAPDDSLFAATRTVEAMARIYRSLSPNQDR